MERMHVITQSGTRYVIARAYGAQVDTVTRWSESPIRNYSDPIVRQPIKDCTEPDIGAPWRFQIEGAGWVTTSPVVDVMIPIAN